MWLGMLLATLTGFSLATDLLLPIGSCLRLRSLSFTHLSNRLSISFLPAKQTTLKSMAGAVKRELPKGLSK